MRAPKKGKAQTRISVLKNSPLISVIPQRPVEDFGTFSRFEGNPVPYEHEFYSTVFKGIFSLDLTNAGVFLKQQRAGRQNLPEDFKPTKDLTVKESDFWLSKEARIKRVKDVIEVLPHLAGGAMQARHLTRVAPSLVVLGTFKTASHLFSHLARETKGQPDLHLEALKETITKHKALLVGKVFIGLEKGFMEHLEQALKELSKELAEVEFYTNVFEAVTEFSKTITAVVPDTPS